MFLLAQNPSWQSNQENKGMEMQGMGRQEGAQGVLLPSSCSRHPHSNRERECGQCWGAAQPPCPTETSPTALGMCTHGETQQHLHD